MNKTSRILELQNNQPLKLECIKHWLNENNSNFYKAIEDTECHKWKKWQKDKTIFVLPCVCPNRDDECIFIETYRELEKFIQTIRIEDFYKDLLEQYSKILHNQNAVFEWVIDVKQYGNELRRINPKIRIQITSEPRYCKDIQIEETELTHLLEFKRIFNEYYYSEEFENYMSMKIKITN